LFKRKSENQVGIANWCYHSSAMFVRRYNSSKHCTAAVWCQCCTTDFSCM